MTNRVLFITRILLITAIASLIAGMWGGLQRMGWQLPTFQGAIAAYHGPIMVSGFLGTLISLERAKGLGRNWAYIAPLLTGAGAVVIITGISPPGGRILITAGSLGFFVILLFIINLQTSLFTIIMASGSLLWITGNILWILDSTVPRIIALWYSFLVIVIAAERLELSRVINNSSRTRLTFTFIIAVIILGSFVTLADAKTGIRINGAAMLALTGWLILNDVSRHTVRSNRLTRFIAVSLLSGYLWLGIGSAIAIITAPGSGMMYDAMLHSLFLGFVFSMVIAHAPLIFPTILELPVSYRPTFYIPLVLLHSTLIIRIAGDISGGFVMRDIGGLLNALAIIAFLINSVNSIYSSANLKSNNTGN